MKVLRQHYRSGAVPEYRKSDPLWGRYGEKWELQGCKVARSTCLARAAAGELGTHTPSSLRVIS